MPLFKRQPNKPKTVEIAGEDFYTIAVAAQVLNIRGSLLTKNLARRIWLMRHAKLDDSPKGKIYVAASDVEAFRRTRESAFVRQLEKGASF